VTERLNFESVLKLTQSGKMAVLNTVHVYVCELSRCKLMMHEKCDFTVPVCRTKSKMII